MVIGKIDTVRVCGIYGLRSKTTGKWYIGQSVDIEDRWRRYKRLCCKKQPKLLAALKKYGYHDFDTVVLEHLSDDVSILNDREVYWSTFYDSVNNGYNTREFGGSHGRFSAASRLKMAISQTGKPSGFRGRHHTDAAKKLIGLSRSCRVGIPLSADHRKNIGNGNRGKTRGKYNVKPMTAEARAARAEKLRQAWVRRKLMGWTMPMEARNRISNTLKSKHLQN